MQPRIKTALHLLGFSLALAGVAFVVLRLRSYSDQIDLQAFSVRQWSTVTVLTGVYAVANLLLAFAWRNLLQFQKAELSSRESVRIYGLSQLAKYVPGNVFHFASRQSLGAAAGLPGWALAKSAVLELVLITVSASLFLLLVLPLLNVLVSWWGGVLLFGGALAGAIFVLCQRKAHQLAKAIMWYSVFLVVSGLIFCALIWLVSGTQFRLYLLPSWAAVYVLAWLAGLLTPGAPAGLGVREVVTLFFFGASLPQTDLLLILVLGRIVTVGGDLLFFVFSGLMNFRKRQVPNNVSI